MHGGRLPQFSVVPGTAKKDVLYSNPRLSATGYPVSAVTEEPFSRSKQCHSIPRRDGLANGSRRCSILRRLFAVLLGIVVNRSLVGGTGSDGA